MTWNNMPLALFYTYFIVEFGKGNQDIMDMELEPNFDIFLNFLKHYRTPEMDIGQACHLLHHDDPFNQLGPFKLEQLSGQPYITVIHELMSVREMEHFKNYANNKLERSGLSAGITSLKRTSKQTWLDHRIFDVDIGVAMEKSGLPENKTRDSFRQPNGWNHYFMARENFIDDDSVALTVSHRMER